MTAEATSPPESVSVDPQDALPESNWFWRRVTFITATGLILCLFAYALHLGAGWAAWPLTTCLLAVVVIYGVAPSGEQAAKMFASVGIIKAGGSLTSTATATAPSGATATTTATAGKGVVQATVDAVKAHLPEWVR